MKERLKERKKNQQTNEFNWNIVYLVNGEVAQVFLENIPDFMEAVS